MVSEVMVSEENEVNAPIKATANTARYDLAHFSYSFASVAVHLLHKRRE